MWQTALRTYAASGQWPLNVSGTDTRHLLRALTDAGKAQEAVSLLSHPNKANFGELAWEALARTCVPQLSGHQAIAMLLHVSPNPTNTAMATSVLTRLAKPDVDGDDQWRLALRLHRRLSDSTSFAPDNRYHAVMTKLLSSSLLRSAHGPDVAAAFSLPEPYMRWARFVAENQSLFNGSSKPIRAKKPSRLGKKKRTPEAIDDATCNVAKWEEALSILMSLPETAALLPHVVAGLGACGRWSDAFAFLELRHRSLTLSSAHCLDLAALAGRWESALALSNTIAHRTSGWSIASSPHLLRCLAESGHRSIATNALTQPAPPTTTAAAAAGGRVPSTVTPQSNAEAREAAAAFLISTSSSWMDALRLAAAGSLFSSSKKLSSRARAQSIILLFAAGKASILRDWARGQLQPSAATNRGDREVAANTSSGPLLHISPRGYRTILAQLRTVNDSVGAEALADLLDHHLADLAHPRHSDSSSSRLRRQLQRVLCAVHEMIYFGGSRGAMDTDRRLSLVLQWVRRHHPLPESVKGDVVQRLHELGVPFAQAGIPAAALTPDLTKVRWLRRRYIAMKQLVVDTQSEGYPVAEDVAASLVALSVQCGDAQDCFRMLLRPGVDPRALLLSLLRGRWNARLGMGCIAPQVAASVLATPRAHRKQLLSLVGPEVLHAAVALLRMNRPSEGAVFLRQKSRIDGRSLIPSFGAARRAWGRWLPRAVSAQVRGGRVDAFQGNELIELLLQPGNSALLQNSSNVDAAVRHCLLRPTVHWQAALSLVVRANGHADTTSQLVALETLTRASIPTPNALFKRLKFVGQSNRDRRWWLDFAAALGTLCDGKHAAELGRASAEDLGLSSAKLEALGLRQCQSLYRLVERSPPAFVSVLMRGIALLSPNRRHLLLSVLTLCGPGKAQMASLGENPFIEPSVGLAAEGYVPLANSSAETTPSSPNAAPTLRQSKN